MTPIQRWRTQNIEIDNHLFKVKCLDTGTVEVPTKKLVQPRDLQDGRSDQSLAHGIHLVNAAQVKRRVDEDGSVLVQNRTDAGRVVDH